MISFLLHFLLHFLLQLLVAIIILVLTFIYRSKILIYIVRFIFWISNKDIEIKDFRLSIVYEQDFNLDAIQDIGKRFTDEGFEINFSNAYNFIINKTFSYKVSINKSFYNNDPELGEIPFSIGISPMVRKFSYRSGINDLASEFYTILQQLSSLGVNKYYIVIVLNGKIKRIHLENTNDMAHEVRKEATGGIRLNFRAAS